MKKVIRTDKAPAAIGPYSQAIVAGGWLYTAGQIPLDPATGAMEAGDVAAQTRRVLANLEAVLAAAGVSWADVVKVNIYLTDLADFAAVNEVYAGVAGAEPPARATVQVAALPKGARVEIDLVAWVGDR